LDITGPRRIDSVRTTRASRTVSNDGKGFAPEESTQATAAGLTGTGPIAAVDTILALQGVDDSPEQRRRGTRHGEQLLNLLDEIRDGLLAGAIPKAMLQRLAAATGVRRESFADPKLQGILEEIELRALVELAKLERAESPSSRSA
jgi:hypothetical protein